MNKEELLKEIEDTEKIIDRLKRKVKSGRGKIKPELQKLQLHLADLIDIYTQGKYPNIFNQ